MKDKKIGKKLPAFFKKNLAKDKFEKNVLKRISKASDKELLQSLLKLNDEKTALELKREPDKKELKKLKSLAKEIKDSKGIIKIGPLAMVAVFVGLIIVFDIFIKNPLFKALTENALESIFMAKSEIRGFDFSIIKARIYLGHVEVANKNKPFRNLFELGKTEIKLNSIEMLKGKVIIENIECQNIEWSTEREKSGELPYLAKKKEQDKKKAGAKKQDGEAKQEAKAESDSESFDPKALIDQYEAELKSPPVIETANKNMAEKKEIYEKAFNEGQKDIDGIQKNYSEIKNIKPSNIKTPEDAQKALKAISTFSSDVSSLSKNIKETSTGFSKDYKIIKSQTSEIKTLMENDYKFLSSKVKGGMGGDSLLSDATDTLIGQYLADYSDYAHLAKDALFNMKREPDKKPVKVKKKRREGRIYYFPTTNYPKFWLKNMAVSIGEKGTDKFTYFNLKDVTSDPDLIDKEAVFVFSKIEGRLKSEVEGYVDSRTIRKNTFFVGMQLENFPLKLSGLNSINVDELDSKYSLVSTFTIQKDEDVIGKLAVKLYENKIKPGDKKDLINKTVVEVLQGLDVIEISAAYSVKNGNLSLKSGTNADKAIAKSVGKLAQAKAKEYQDALKKELQDRLASKLGENSELLKSIENLKSVSDAQDKLTEEMKNTAEKKKKEIEKQATQGVTDTIKDKVKLPF